MQVLIRVYYVYNDVKVLSQGDMKVHPRKFREDPDVASSEVANHWIREIQSEFPGMDVYKVTYNSIDITDLCK